MLGPVADQPVGQGGGMDFRRAEHGEGSALGAAWHCAERIRCFLQQRLAQHQPIGPHFARHARCFLRLDPRQNPPRQLAVGRAPVGLDRGHQIGLRLQHHPVIQHFQAVGLQRRAGGGDIDDQFGLACGGRAFGCPQAFNDAVVGDAVGTEKLPGQMRIFGRHPHAPAAPGTIGRRDILKIGHVAHVDPGLRHADHDMGVAKAERGQHFQLGVGIANAFTHQILTGDAQMRGPGGQLRDDFGGRQKGDLNAGHLRQPAAIIARAPGLHHIQPGAGEKGIGIFLQAAFRGHAEHQRRGGTGHRQSSSRRSIQIAAPTAGMAWPPFRLASRRS